MQVKTIDYKYKLQVTNNLSIIYISVYNIKQKFETIAGYNLYLNSLYNYIIH